MRDFLIKFKDLEKIIDVLGKTVRASDEKPPYTSVSVYLALLIIEGKKNAGTFSDKNVFIKTIQLVPSKKDRDRGFIYINATKNLVNKTEDPKFDNYDLTIDLPREGYIPKNIVEKVYIQLITFLYNSQTTLDIHDAVNELDQMDAESILLMMEI